MQAQNFVRNDSVEIAKQQLDSVVVKAERSLVKVKADAGMVYDAALLASNHPVANAYDLLGEIPVVEKEDEKVDIIGVGKTTIVVNGRKRQMTKSEMVSYLSSLDKSQVKSIEVYHDAPPQFGVNGGVINVILQQKRSDKLACNAGLWTSLYQSSKYYQTGGINLNLFQKKWMWDTGFSLGNMQGIKNNVLSSQHRIDDVLYHIETYTKRYVKSQGLKVTSNFNYDFSKTERFEWSYVYRDDSPDYSTRSPLIKDGVLISVANSQFDNSKHSHSLQANFVGKTWNVGGSFVFYKEKSYQDMIERDGVAPILSSFALQDTKTGEFYANHKLSLGNGRFNYGINLEWTRSENSYSNIWASNSSGTNEAKDNVLREQNYDGFLGWSQKLGKVTLTAHITLNYYKSILEQGNDKQSLWDGFTIMPNFSATYKTSKMNSWVLSFSSDRSYPSFSVSSGRKAYYNTYIYLETNSAIKPYYTYNVHLNYVMRNKYILGFYSTLSPHRFGQLLYLNPDALEAGYQYFSYDRNNSYGLMLVVPHRWNSWFTSRLTSYASCLQLKGKFRDIDFDRNKIECKFILKNDVVLDKRKTMSLQVTTAYNSPFMADYVDIAAQFTSSLAMVWNPYKTNWSFVLKANDLFDTLHPKRIVNYGNQCYTSKQYKDLRKVNLTIRYSIKGYKNKQQKEVDLSRMGL